MKYKLIVFDFGGVLVNTFSSWVTLHKYFGTYKESRKQFNMYHKGEISYQKWCEMNIELWNKKKKANKEIMEKAIAENITKIKGADELLKKIKERGYKIAVISGDLNITLEHYFDKNLFDYIFINQIFFDKDGNIIGVKGTNYDFKAKVQALKAICKREGIKLEECIAILDDAYGNDLELAKVVGYSIAFNSKSEKLNKIADVVIKKKDLKEILKYIDL